MGKSKKGHKNKNSTNTLESFLLLGFISVIVLHLIGGFWHSYYSWGFSYWSVIPNNFTIVCLLGSLGSLVFVYTMRYKIKANIFDSVQFKKKPKLITILVSLVSTILIGFILFLFRSKAHVYGDGYLLIDNVLLLENMLAKTKNYMELLTIFTYYFLTVSVQEISTFSTEVVIGLLNSIGGVVGFWGIYKIAGLLSRNLKEKLFFIVISLSSASIILFFGYIENYTWAFSIMLWSIYFSIKYIKNLCSIYPLLISTLIAFAFHMITLPMIATVVYILLIKVDSKNKVFEKLKRLYVVIIIALGSLIIMLLAQFKELDVFVPLWDLPNNNYSLFTFSHLSDILNLLLLIAPLGVVFFLVSLQHKKNIELNSDSTEKVLFMISLLTFLSTCVIDPQLGMLRDWDLFSFYGIPLTLWSGYRLTRLYSDKQFPPWIIIASTIIVFVHIVPNMYEKNNSQIAVEYLDKVLWEDPHYHVEYKDAFRGLSWAYTLTMVVNREDLADKYYTKRASIKGKNVTALFNMGVMYYRKNQYDSARYFLQKGYQLTPEDPRFLAELSVIESRTKNYTLSEKYAREALALDSNFLPALSALAILCAEQNRTNESLIYFRKAYNIKPNNYEQNIHLGMFYSRGNNVDSAYFYMKKSLSLAPENQKPNILSSLISTSLHLHQKEKAIEYLNQLKAIAPNSPIIKAKEKEVFAQ